MQQKEVWKGQRPSLTPKGKRKYKTIALVLFLLCAGLFLLVEGYLMADETPYWERASVCCIGLLVLIPGGYFSAVIGMIEAGVSGYNYRMIPQQQ